MPATLPPGIGTSAEVDQANQFIREQPWYQEFLQREGQNPQGVNLSGDASDRLLQLARDKGIGISDHFEIDQSGNIKPKTHLARNLLIAAGIGTAAILAGPAVLSAFAGGGTPAATAAAAETAGTLGSTAIGTGMAGTIAGAVPVGMVGGAATGAGTFGAIGSAAAAGGSTFGKIGSILSKAGPIARTAAQGVGAATTAAGANRLEQEKLALEANQQNITGMNTFESALSKRAELEQKQRNDALKNIYRSGVARNPAVSPYNPVGVKPASQAYLEALSNLESQAGKQLATGPQYLTSSAPALQQYKPIDIRDVQGATNTKKGALETFGDWLAPGLSTYGAVADALGR
jgi:hypothetical protein